MKALVNRFRGANLRRLLKRLDGDQGGNLYVIYIAGCLLMIGMIWAIIGTGQRMVQKETIQSSADAAAFSAAVIKAKTFNLIAFCNLLLALLLALVMLLRAIKYALYAFAALCWANCFNPFGGEILCAAAEPVTQFAVQFTQWDNRIEPVIKKIMKGINVTERALAKVAPALSSLEGFHVGTHASYREHNYGSTNLISVPWPVYQKLPVKDGTCDEMAKQSQNDFNALIDMTIGKFPIGGSLVASLFKGALGVALNPLKKILCGGSADMTFPITSSDCNTCQSHADKVTKSYWDGKPQIRVKEVCDKDPGYKFPDGTGCDGKNPGSFAPSTVQHCTMNSMPSDWECPKAANTVGPGVTCDSDSDHLYYKNSMSFQRCEYDEKEKANVAGDWPLPLVFEDGWEKKRYTKAYSVLAKAGMDYRRRSVNVAAKSGQGSAPLPLDGVIGMAQAEVLGYFGHEDLWHMDWRARLVRFGTKAKDDKGEGDAADGDAGGGEGVPAEAVSAVQGAVDQVDGKGGGDSGGFIQMLKDQFILH